MPRPSQKRRSQDKGLSVSAKEAGMGLQAFLQGRLDLSGRKVKALLDTRNVLVNGKRVWMSRHELRSGDKVLLPYMPEGKPEVSAKGAAKAPVPLLYRDRWILAVNKAPGLVSDRDKHSLEARLQEELDLPDLRALHRLDKDTSGLLLFTLREQDRDPYVELFRNKRIHKRYLVLVSGKLAAGKQVVRRRLDGKEAESRFQRLQQKGAFSLALCEIPTGRTHQIRRHLQDLDCRVAGDRAYGQQRAISPEEQSLPRQMLHALDVRFPCPHTSAELQLQAPLPKDFQKAVSALGLKTPELNSLVSL